MSLHRSSQLGLFTHLLDLACTVVCWLEGAGGEATAAVGDWETTHCCIGVGGVYSPGDWSGVTAVAGWALGSTAGVETRAAWLRLIQ